MIHLEQDKEVCKRMHHARIRSGLTISQAAKFMEMAPVVLLDRETEHNAFTGAEIALASVAYAVSPKWLLGMVPLRKEPIHYPHPVSTISAKDLDEILLIMAMIEE